MQYPCSVSTHSTWRAVQDRHPGHKPRGLGLPQVWDHHPGKHHPQLPQLLVSAFRLQSQKADVQGGANKRPLIRGGSTNEDQVYQGGEEILGNRTVGRGGLDKSRDLDSCPTWPLILLCSR